MVHEGCVGRVGKRFGAVVIEEVCSKGVKNVDVGVCAYARVYHQDKKVLQSGVSTSNTFQIELGSTSGQAQKQQVGTNHI